jgi:hypothetical protein
LPSDTGTDKKKIFRAGTKVVSKVLLAPVSTGTSSECGIGTGALIRLLNKLATDTGTDGMENQYRYR